MTISSTTGTSGSTGYSSSSSGGTTTNTPSTLLTSYSVDRSGLTVAQAVQLKLMPYQEQLGTLNGEIINNQTHITAYKQMQSLLQTLENSAAALDTVTNPSTGSSTDVFDNRTATLSNSDTIAASSLMSATVAAGTTTGAHQISIQQVATAERIGGSVSTTSATAALNLTGSFTIGEAGKTAATINVASTNSLSDIVNAINNQSATTGVSAQVITVASGSQYELVLTGNDTNTTFNLTDTTGGSNPILTGLGLAGSATGNSSTYTAPTGGGTVYINGTAISIASGASVATIASDIAAQSATTGVTATTDANGYLVLSPTTSNGQPVVVTSDPNGIMSGLGIASSSTPLLQAPQPAILNVDGVNNIQRSTNTISDVLNGVTLNLLQADKTGTITLNINPDTNSVQTAIQSFVTAYNNWKTWVNANNATQSDGTANPNAVLFGDSTLREADTAVQNALSSIVNETPTGSPSGTVTGWSLGAIGITMDQNNLLQIDSATLTNALTNNFSQIQSLFEYQANTSSGDLQLADHTDATYSGTFSLNFVNGVLTPTGSGNDASASFTQTGGVITGNTGTPYAGLTFNYSGTTSETITADVTQGIGDQLYQTTTNYADPNFGSIQTINIDNLVSQDANWQAQVSSLTVEMNNYENFLLIQYGSLESSISQANQTSTLLQSMMAYDTSSVP
ncbi:MAG: flagellar filament capping protein FliD [Magnetospirillum sp.]|nr:flagellar filament capping protein FliD [Magnetospirillum sp.]